MCISARPAHFAKTKIMTIPLENGNHFTAYENNAINIGDTPNCMILPIPGRTKSEWFIDTSLYNKFLKEIVEETAPRSRGISLSKSLSFSDFKVGQYRVGLCDSLDQMNAFLASLPVEEKPEVSEELLSFFATNYPNFSFAICLFSASSKMESQPIAYEYTPLNPEQLFFPTMDSHDGTPPKRVEVEMDHAFILPSTFNNYYKDNDYFTQVVPAFIKKQAFESFEQDSKMMNGDTVVFYEKGKRSILTKTFQY